MFRVLLYSTLLLQALHAFEYSKQTFQFFLELPLPNWAQAQIDEDLAPFASGFSIQDIDTTLRKVYQTPAGKRAAFVRYTIQDNQISIETDQHRSDARIAHVIEVLQDLAKHYSLPNTTFLVSLWDSYDNPLYLENTTCPVFTICKLKDNRCGVLYPEFRNFSYRAGVFRDVNNWAAKEFPWAKKVEKAYWRGMTSGYNYTLHNWDTKPRSRLVLLSQARPDLIDAAFSHAYEISPALKTLMESYKLFHTWVYPDKNVLYKYLISIDGNTFASNLWWQLLSNSAVLKSDSDYVEWFYKGIHPNVHYFPFSPDCSDLETKLLYLKTHDREAKRIAEAGRQFAQEYLTNESLMVYFYKLLQNYAQLVRK